MRRRHTPAHIPGSGSRRNRPTLVHHEPLKILLESSWNLTSGGRTQDDGVRAGPRPSPRPPSLSRSIARLKPCAANNASGRPHPAATVPSPSGHTAWISRRGRRLQTVTSPHEGGEAALPDAAPAPAVDNGHIQESDRPGRDAWLGALAMLPAESPPASNQAEHSRRSTTGSGVAKPNLTAHPTGPADSPQRTPVKATALGSSTVIGHCYGNFLHDAVHAALE
jgi:hypothetical protein